jgi:glutamate racemase
MGRNLIGIFDSGSGGLTVMRALENELPAESFAYLGDHENAPYGNRSAADIYDLTLQGVRRLFDLGCSLVVIACNTAAATGLRQLQTTWLPAVHPLRRVIGVVVPVIEEITGVSWHADAIFPPGACDTGFMHVAIFATTHTVQTGVYAAEIGRRAPAIRVSQQACPELAKMIDDGVAEQAIRQAVRRYIAELLAACRGIPDACVLGCTHYPLVERIFVEELPAGVRLVSQSLVTAASLKRYLARHPEFLSDGHARREYLTTGDADQVSALASRYYGRPVPFRSWRTLSQAIGSRASGGAVST